MFQMAPKTQALLDYFLVLDYGDLARYGQILQATKCDVMDTDRSRVYSVVRRLENEHERTLLNERGVGYRVARPAEHLASMGIRKGRASRQIELAQKTGRATAVSLLDDDESRRLSDAMNHLSRISQAVAHHDVRLDRIERHDAHRDERMERIEKHLGMADGNAETVDALGHELVEASVDDAG